MVFERKVLRRIFGPTKERDGTWRIKTNDELDELIRHRNIINDIKAQRLSWFGHLHRMSEDRMVNRVYKWKPILTRPLGRPKNRWEDDIIHDMKKLKIKNWTGCIQDRNRWKLCVEKAKTFKEWSCSAWRRRNKKNKSRFSFTNYLIFLIKAIFKKSYFIFAPRIYAFLYSWLPKSLIINRVPCIDPLHLLKTAGNTVVPSWTAAADAFPLYALYILQPTENRAHWGLRPFPPNYYINRFHQGSEAPRCASTAGHSLIKRSAQHRGFDSHTKGMRPESQDIPTKKNSTLFCVDLRTNSHYFPTQY